ncbi:MAG: hypothetical protein LC104_17505 [Bacteroidales bacterium]|nr:hypothetical protein [Bacteroidales bacterium]
MTGIGKLFVYLNLFVSVTLVIWATSLYANRLPYLNATTAEGQTVKGTLNRAQEEITDFTRRIAEISQMYGSRSDLLLNGEAYRQQRLDFYTTNLDQARNGNAVGGAVFREFELVGRVGPLINIGAAGTVSPDAKGRPLRGLKDIQADLDRSIRDAGNYRAAIFQARSDHQKTSTEIEDIDARTVAQRTILMNLTEEATYLGSLQVNWDEELRILTARQNQLERRLQSMP